MEKNTAYVLLDRVSNLYVKPRHGRYTDNLTEARFYWSEKSAKRRMSYEAHNAYEYKMIEGRWSRVDKKLDLVIVKIKVIVDGTQ